jgi:hypothetical protein
LLLSCAPSEVGTIQKCEHRLRRTSPQQANFVSSEF